METGIEWFRVQFPKGQDANQYASMTQPAAKALGVLLTSAAWMGKGKRPSTAVMEPTPAVPASQEEEQKPEPMNNQEPPAAFVVVPSEKKTRPSTRYFLVRLRSAQACLG